MIAVTVADFEMRAIEVRYHGIDNTEDIHPAWSVPYSFCVSIHSKDARELRSEEAEMIFKKLSVRKRNLKLVQMLYV